ncbi:DinB family protein [Candidatus Acetothermia bacterium]|nr:DinB family protein [Candidatus Acetothermia bacterium]MBI3643049.1 DinB family protein [Candidatus Acetothermia bacterium]
MSLPKFESLRVESLMELFAKSAKAIPADHFEWRPQQGGKSASEILEHVIGANHMFATLIRGEKMPESGTQDFSIRSSQLKKGFEKMQQSALVLSEAIAAVDDSQLLTERKMPWGEVWKLSKLISTPSSHISHIIGGRSAICKHYGAIRKTTISRSLLIKDIS